MSIFRFHAAWLKTPKVTRSQFFTLIFRVFGGYTRFFIKKVIFWPHFLGSKMTPFCWLSFFDETSRNFVQQTLFFSTFFMIFFKKTLLFKHPKITIYQPGSRKSISKKSFFCLKFSKKSSFLTYFWTPDYQPGSMKLTFFKVDKFFKKMRFLAIFFKIYQPGGIKFFSTFSIFCHFWPHFGHFWSFFAIFGHF